MPPDVARIAADPARAAMLRLLMDGSRRPAGELAYAAHVSVPSASVHLAKLVGAGLVAWETQGRHRYFRLASADVASAVESLASLGAAVLPRAPKSAVPKAETRSRQFLRSRTCYDHLAGEVAVRLLESMLKARWLIADGSDFRVSASGRRRFGKLDIDIDEIGRSRRALARGCVDLTQRRLHLGGALGAALLEACISRGWIVRNRSSRAVTVAPKGAAAFEKMFAR